MARSTSTPAFSFSTIEAKPVQFVTTRKGTDRRSAAVTMLDARYDETSQSIKIFCSDGKLRECRIERLPSVEQARALWKAVTTLGKAKTPVTFVAAGGFTPDRWFYTVEAAK